MRNLECERVLHASYIVWHQGIAFVPGVVTYKGCDGAMETSSS